MGHSPDQYSTRWQCCSGNRFRDDMHSHSSEGVDGGSECHLDWSRWKSYWCREYHCGTCKNLWHQDHPISYATLPTVTRRRGILLQGSYQCSRIWDTPANISIYTTQCYKYVKTKLTCFYGCLFHESDFLLHNRSGNSSAEIWTIAALCELDQSTRCGYTVCTCMQSVHVCVQLHACRIIEIIKKENLQGVCLVQHWYIIKLFVCFFSFSQLPTGLSVQLRRPLQQPLGSGATVTSSLHP